MTNALDVRSTSCGIYLRRLVGTTAPGHHDCSTQNEKVSNHGSIPITIDCNVVAFIVFEEVLDSMIPPAHNAHQTVSFSDVTVFRHTLVD
ncbi:hypothetical protein TNCV_990231 [Trichonephila clavipes]|nr:hypothetical protein TNCV_990231 [Trichonephila clavipes]